MLGQSIRGSRRLVLSTAYALASATLFPLLGYATEESSWLALVGLGAALSGPIVAGLLLTHDSPRWGPILVGSVGYASLMLAMYLVSRAKPLLEAPAVLAYGLFVYAPLGLSVYVVLTYVFRGLGGSTRDTSQG